MTTRWNSNKQWLLKKAAMPFILTGSGACDAWAWAVMAHSALEVAQVWRRRKAAEMRRHPDGDDPGRRCPTVDFNLVINVNGELACILKTVKESLIILARQNKLWEGINSMVIIESKHLQRVFIEDPRELQAALNQLSVMSNRKQTQNSQYRRAQIKVWLTNWVSRQDRSFPICIYDIP